MGTSWQFWIDVGGTFTDCIARSPEGELWRHKLLSSGATKGQASDGSSQQAVVDSARRGDPPDFWGDYLLRLFDHRGTPLGESLVVHSDQATGRLHLKTPLKVSSVAGKAYELTSDEEAPIVAIRQMLGLSRQQPIPPCSMRLGTTRGTNALLTRRGARTALLTTTGFGDILSIGYQNRPQLFALDVAKPAPLAEKVIEADGRITAEGVVLQDLNPQLIRKQLAQLKNDGLESLAICLLHGALFPEQEQLIAELARQVGFTEISLSHEVAPLIKIVARGQTTVLDAYLNPVLRGYLAQLQESLPAGELRLMTSAGGLVQAESFRGKESILSGPAGGVVGVSAVAKAAGFPRAIGFDMGGTSTDVCRCDGRLHLEYESEKAGVRVVAPMMAIETVAAGGGSICTFDGVKLVVGPDSAGADPGPACYGQGGPLCVTDLNYYLGKLWPEKFPFPLAGHAVQERLSELSNRIAKATGKQYSLEDLAEGFLQVANANMVKAIGSVSLAKGYDPRDYVLVAFGAAANQHACAIARELGQRQILNHPDAGILSAYGIGTADIVRHRQQGLYVICQLSAFDQVQRISRQLAQAAQTEVLAEGIAPENLRVRRLIDLRYQGLEEFLTIPEPTNVTPESDHNSALDHHFLFDDNPDANRLADLAESYCRAYEAEHQRLYGYRHTHKRIEIGAVRVEVTGSTPDPTPAAQATQKHSPQPVSQTQGYFRGRHLSMPVYDRAALRPGAQIAGPALIYEQVATTVIDPGWQAEVLGRGELLLTDQQPGTPSQLPQTTADPAEPDPVLLEVFNNQFAGIAEQMGVTLQKTASSVNVKERLDFSCALFTASGELVVNAPHIPVHLGAMGVTVKAILEDHPDLKPGDVLVTNDPYRGGSHLPDVTVITPVFEDSGELSFLTASRAHHAELGGIVPGSMPPFSTNLAEEGVLISATKLIDGGQQRLQEFRQLLSSGPFPSRNVEDNLADVQAQIAANRQGAAALQRMISRYGLPLVKAYMGHIQKAAEGKLRQALGRLPNGRRRFVDFLDDGSAIAVTMTIQGQQVSLDFTGTANVSPSNLNANRAIVTAAVMYCLRLLIQEEIPLNEGVLAPVEILLPPGLLNPQPGATPEQSPAVVGGNVETSQRIVDVLLGAFGVAAASQGTMNNLTLGDPTFGYYETICGGAGATSNGPGADAVHTHMTNTRLTDPEVLERRYPVRLLEFSIRQASGGAGRYPGGRGVLRRLKFLKELEVSLLTQRRGPYPPYGLCGGGPGACGKNLLIRADGSREPLGGQAKFLARPGDVLVLETPGGGGWGLPSYRDRSRDQTP